MATGSLLRVALAAAVAFVLALCSGAVAGAPVPVPALTGRVVDQTGTLAPEQKAALESRLQALEADKGSQLAVLLVPTTGEETIEQYGLRVAEQWQLGRKGIDDGALLLVVKEDRSLRIEVGYGLEGALTDATSKRIVSEVITPYFRQGDFYGGISAGLERMIAVIEGEPLPAPRAQRPAAGGGGLFELFPVVLVLVLALGGALRAIFGRVLGAVLAGGATTVVAWLISGTFAVALVAGAIALFFTLLGGGMGPRGMWYPHRGRGRYRSGGFGGGFGGGGGGFGGGGASGRW